MTSATRFRWTPRLAMRRRMLMSSTPLDTFAWARSFPFPLDRRQ